MLYPKIEDCVAAIGGCKYTLAVIAAKLAKDLAVKMPGEFTEGKPKELSYALNEIAKGKVSPVFSSAT